MPQSMEYGWSKAVAITTSDTVNIFPTGADLKLVEAIYVGGAGNFVAVLEDNSTVTFTAPPVGSIIPIRVKRINATGTTATALVGLYAV